MKETLLDFALHLAAALAALACGAFAHFTHTTSGDLN